MINTTEIDSLLHNGKSKEAQYKNDVIRDFWVCVVSRECSLMARKEVLLGRASFGITGAGKEIAQIALSKYCKNGDFRSGYYRDQTWMFAEGIMDVESFFAHLYGDAANDPFTGGRQFNNHFCTPMLDENGEWIDQTKQFNVTSDISNTAGQMGRALGIALASKRFRDTKVLETGFEKFTSNGNEISLCSIGDASTSEGGFWETMNAACVMKVPLAVSVWDDGYGISVPIDYQTTKKSISKALAGMKFDKNGDGMYMFNAKGWDYPGLCEMYEKGLEKVRKNHIPALFHITEMTQPQGHSTSGSHERYKSEERLKFEIDKDGIEWMSKWMIKNKILSKVKMSELREIAIDHVKEQKSVAWNKYSSPPKSVKLQLVEIYKGIQGKYNNEELNNLVISLGRMANPLVNELISNARRMTYKLNSLGLERDIQLDNFVSEQMNNGGEIYSSHLFSSSANATLQVAGVDPIYDEDAPNIPGFEILNKFFDHILEHNHAVFAFGEDVGRIGDVNQGLAGMQDKYGEERVFDTGIREWTIVGQAIGMSMRGLRPIAEMQYLDYLPYGFSPLTDDLATVRYRSNGQQMAPAIIRTRGHRLVGIFHAGSPMGMLINSMKGIHLLVPRDMTQAAGMYNTLLAGDDPAIVVECLNGYRYKEKLPSNLFDFKIPLGVPEILNEGSDVTLVSYGSMIRLCEEAIGILKEQNISVELIDVRSLMPFDLEHRIVLSLKKTNRILFADEDVPGGATGFMMQNVIEEQGGYRYLDAKPKTLTSKVHRPAYTKDGEYFSKPSVEDIVDSIYEIMNENDPMNYPL